VRAASDTTGKSRDHIFFGSPSVLQHSVNTQKKKGSKNRMTTRGLLMNRASWRRKDKRGEI
jgi:hypothetical protein